MGALGSGPSTMAMQQPVWGPNGQLNPAFYNQYQPQPQQPMQPAAPTGPVWGPNGQLNPAFQNQYQNMPGARAVAPQGPGLDPAVQAIVGRFPQMHGPAYGPSAPQHHQMSAANPMQRVGPGLYRGANGALVRRNQMGR